VYAEAPDENVAKLTCIIRITTDEGEEQLNRREAQLCREQEAHLERLRLTRLGMQNETLQKKQERLENQRKAHQQIVEEWKQREINMMSRLED
jgi:hypothetical protein